MKKIDKLVERIRYITKREDKLGFKTAEISEMIENLSSKSSIGLDIEATALDPYRAKLLLSSIGDDKITYVIDHTTISPEFLKKLSHIRIIGHNLKYDTKVLLNYGVEFEKCYDTMIVEQTLRMGVKGGNSLDKVLERRLNIVSQFEKSTREDFINATSFVPERKHIVYSAEDTLYIKLLMEAQKPFILSYDMTRVLVTIEFPLVLHLAKSEYEGIRFNKPKHNLNIKKMDESLLDIEQKMDEQVVSLCEVHKIPLVGKWGRKRKTESLIQTSMFDVKPVIIKNKNKGNINYDSTKQIQELFMSFNQPIPLIKDGFGYKESTGVDAINSYLSEDKGGRLEPFLRLLLSHRGISKQISSFGQNLIDIINEHSGNIHTIYRQASADTGRFQSGDTKNGYINSQQIPALENFRTCFGQYDSDSSNHEYEYMTMDLSGAELVILASNADDDTLKSILDDPHSAIATVSTQALINYIMTNMTKSGYTPNSYSSYSKIPQSIIQSNQRAYQELLDILKKEERAKEVFVTGEFVVSKKTSKDIRNSYKAIIYGLAYGASASKISEVMNICMDYANIIENAISKLIPKTFSYLNRNANFGVHSGYVITCSRTNSRRWFKEIVEAKQRGYPPEQKVIGEVERACKNSPIQGTQAFMVKEASVDILDYFKDNKIDANIIMWVHDEWVIRLPKQPRIENTEVTVLSEKIKSIALEACNKYLKKGYKMDADYSINDTWVK